MNSKFENLELQRRQALAKKNAIEANSAQLRKKLEIIQKQLILNDEKVKKLDHFLQDLEHKQSTRETTANS